ncbi:raw score 3.72 domain protein [Streptococcus pneumoniae GA11304]|nr:raw score 3.72 domain protein [Streptococcus pneumoniae GA11304]EHZ20988.1 hypothetical protein SPAR33_2011 [Streptococcus pneumoniae GA13723]
MYRDEHLFINVSGRGGKDLAAIADYLEAKNNRWKNYSSFSHRELVVAENKQRKL